ncbi:MAG: hypothetical protein D6794_05820 [Deltaproteobacteria bacterium]|nr:MAG: hypothetical protein D6794_05820 [Deltaproteobacteria bacterium]
MREQLVQAGLWDAGNPNNPARSVTAARQLLNRLNVRLRYLGRDSAGRYQYLVYHPETGEAIGTGLGETPAVAICRAALAARRDGQVLSASH